jgi:acyl carrier protein
MEGRIMLITKEQVREIVISSLKETMEQAGHDVPKDVRDSTQPIKDLGLDSPMGVNFACAVSAHGIEVPDTDNPFIDDVHKKRPRNIGEIVDHLLSLAMKQQKGVG